MKKIEVRGVGTEVQRQSIMLNTEEFLSVTSLLWLTSLRVKILSFSIKANTDHMNDKFLGHRETYGKCRKATCLRHQELERVLNGPKCDNCNHPFSGNRDTLFNFHSSEV